jgi:hypothetical protein
MAATLLACNSYDSDFFPYAMHGMNVLVYDDNTKKEYFGGFIEASYMSRRDGLARCASAASAIARQNSLRDWSYVCCTVTSSSGCATKVR